MMILRQFTIDVRSSLSELQLFTVDGKPVAQYRDIPRGRHSFDLSHVPSGMYVFSARSTDGDIQAGKWVKFE